MPMRPEQRARETIDLQVAAAGWAVQRRREINLHVGRGIAASGSQPIASSAMVTHMLLLTR